MDFINQTFPTVRNGVPCVPTSGTMDIGTKPIQQHTLQWPLPCTSCCKDSHPFPTEFLECHIYKYPMYFTYINPQMYLIDLPHLTVANCYSFTIDSSVWLDRTCVRGCMCTMTTFKLVPTYIEHIQCTEILEHTQCVQFLEN